MGSILGYLNLGKLPSRGESGSLKAYRGCQNLGSGDRV